jgi:hypothetical protein
MGSDVTHLAEILLLSPPFIVVVIVVVVVVVVVIIVVVVVIPAGFQSFPVFSVPVSFFKQESRFLFRHNIFGTP